MISVICPWLRIVLGLCLATVCAGLAEANPSDAYSSKKAMQFAVRHLLNIQDKHGLFVYDYDLKGNEPTGKNNVVRQAGTAYGLAEYFVRHPSPEIKIALRRALSALHEISVRYGKSQAHLVTEMRTVEKAKTGATALALLTEVQYYRATKDDRFKEFRSHWLNGLFAMRLDGKAFRKKPRSRKESPYYNGEAWLALAYYQDTFSDRETADALAKLDEYLIKKYTAEPEIGFFHWGVMAAAVRYSTTGSAKHVKFIEAQTKSFLDQLRPIPHPKANTCYALEGLLTAFVVLADRPESSALQARLKPRIALEVKKNLALQIRPGYKIQPRLGHNSLAPIAADYVGAFLGRSYSDYTRIDYTQHCLSALVKLHTNKKLEYVFLSE
ncbi:hypothetical protein MnTg02_02793 [bacterium MnTg02]|nr:hypothetical protein MnTg02_02793 [bacterium MnTg02]